MSIYARESGSVVSVTPGVRLRCAITPGVRLRCVITPGVRLRYFSDNRESDSVVSMTKKVVRLDGVIYKLTVLFCTVIRKESVMRLLPPIFLNIQGLTRLKFIRK